jgi:hypothetical protein
VCPAVARPPHAWIVVFAATMLAGCGDGSGPAAEPEDPDVALEAFEHWHRVALDTTGLDHTPVAPGENRTFGVQIGPGRSARAMAIVHITVFEVVNAIEGGFQSYIGLPAAPAGTSMAAAIDQAAHDTLVALYPSHQARLDEVLAGALAGLSDGQEKTSGVALGHNAAEGILALRAGDGSDHPEPLYGIDYLAGNGAGEWRQDPVSQHPLALGARWAEVQPFALSSASQFRAPPPPALTSAAYATAYDEVQRFGGDGVATPTERTEEQSFIGVFWAYDGTPSLCAPPRLYNQIAMTVAGVRGSDLADTARLLALVNVAMADAGIAIWESKYFYKYWRPVAGIRESDPGTGPTGTGDGNAATIGDAAYTPLGAPASNEAGVDFTPPFPAYPSGHAGFGGALFQMLRRFYGTDDIVFTFVSDEWNGVTTDRQGQIRPLRPRQFPSLSAAEEENGQSRIYLGIHWSFDKTEGIAQGRQVADFVYDSVFQPAP